MSSRVCMPVPVMPVTATVPPRFSVSESWDGAGEAIADVAKRPSVIVAVERSIMLIRSQDEVVNRRRR